MLVELPACLEQDVCTEIRPKTRKKVIGSLSIPSIYKKIVLLMLLCAVFDTENVYFWIHLCKMAREFETLLAKEQVAACVQWMVKESVFCQFCAKTCSFTSLNFSLTNIFLSYCSLRSNLVLFVEKSHLSGLKSPVAKIHSWPTPGSFARWNSFWVSCQLCHWKRNFLLVDCFWKRFFLFI